METKEGESKGSGNNNGNGHTKDIQVEAQHKAVTDRCNSVLFRFLESSKYHKDAIDRIKQTPNGKGLSIFCTSLDDADIFRGARSLFLADILDDPKARAPEIVIIANRLNNVDEDVIEVLNHELVHAYDHCVQRYNLTSCEALACSEVRAAIASECASNEKSKRFGDSSCSILTVLEGMMSYDLSLAKNRCHVSCVRDRASASMRARMGEAGVECVNKVFDTCYQNDQVLNKAPASL